MKLLKAFIRTNKVDTVVQALREAHAPGITIGRVHGVGYGYEPVLFTMAPSQTDKAMEVAKLEIVCTDEQVEMFIEVILDTAHTGYSGDGIVFVTEVERAIKIRTRAEAPESLEG